MKLLLRFLFVVICYMAIHIRGAHASQVVFSEVMYNPGGAKPEFIEISNLSATPLDMARWSFTDGVAFTFPDFSSANSQAHFLKPYERILVSSADAAATRAAYPTIPATVRIFGPWTGSLDNAGETVTVRDKNDVIVCTLGYRDEGKWPIAPDGTGHSLVLNDENRAIDDWRVWRASTNNGGSPGAADPARPAAGILLNEVHFDPGTGRVDWVELVNVSSAGTQPVTGLFLASALDFSNKVTLAGDLAVGAVSSYDVNFPVDNNGDVRIFLVDANNRVLDAVKIRRKLGRDSWQVFPAGSGEWFNDTANTKGAANNPARNTAIVINEIMADPPSNQRNGEFIELYNRSASDVNIGGWALDDAVNFTFPAGTSIPAGGYLVVAADAAWLNASYTGVNALGNWTGKLANSGDRIRLEDANGNLVNQVDYRIGGEWPDLAGGNGSSLELVNPNADNSVGSAWKDSDESAKSTFQSFTINGGTYTDLTQGGVNDDEIRLWLVGDGHLIIRNTVLRPTAGGNNLLVNGQVTTLNNNNVEGWQARGTHWATYHDAEGVHIVADGHGDNKCNHAEKDAAGMVAGTAYTLTFEARWIYGKPRLVAQSWDMSWGGTALVPIPSNLGTPGTQNSRYVADAAPQVSGLRHSPAVPTPTSTVTVTARVSSSAPLASVELFHRLDNASYNATWNATAMVDNGTGGDAVAGDGIYTGQVPLSAFSYNASGRVVEFYVKATAANGQSAYLPRGSVEPEPLPSSPLKTGLWVVDSQTTSTDLRRMRIVVSNYWLDALSTPNPGTTTPPGTGTPTSGGGSVKFNYKFPRFSNHYFPCVFIHNDSEIYYGASSRKSGSPFTRQEDNQLTRGRVTLPGDKPFRGKGKLYWDNDGVGGSMLHNRIHRYWLYLFGVPGNENEVCRIARNSTTYAVRETSEVFDKDMLDRIWENGSDGQFFEIDDKFWIGDDGYTRLNNSDGSWDYAPGNSPGAENPVSYHNNFVPKSREPEYDYSSFIEWCKQLENSGGSITQAQIERMADIRAMAAYAAVRGYTADWDNITMSRGKNGFFYNRSTDHKWMLIHWDSDNAFQANHINDAVIGSLTNVATFYARPFVRRYVNYYLSELLGAYAPNGPRLTAWLTAEENASTAYNVPSTYATWPTTIASTGTAQTRVAVVQSFIASSSPTSTFATINPANNATVATETASVLGRALSTAYSVICVGHPEATMTWSGTSIADVSLWMVSGIQLRTGSNTLTFRMLNSDGAQVGSDISLTLNKIGNALPVVALSSSPKSQNVGLGEVLTVDASASYDPEGTALNLSWSVSPASGFVMTAPTSSSRRIVFSTPGTYVVTVQATDGDGQVKVASRTYSVYNASNFDNFSGGFHASYTTTNVEPLDNYSPDTWYSFQETDGSLVIQLTDRTTFPLRSNQPTFPLITRALPDSGDFALQTEFQLETRQFGSFSTGLYVASMESGVVTRYAFGLENGTALKVWRSAGAGSYSVLGTSTYTSGDLAIRVYRVGTSLNFQRRVDGNWVTVFAQTLSGDTTLINGGIYASSGALNASTSTPGQGLRVAFDYLLLADPGSSTDLVGKLRITEIMYNPAGVGGVEFLELRNISGDLINLEGACFESGTPFSTQLTFGKISLAPGQFCVVTNNIAAFTAQYGPSAMIAGEYTGSLSNDGEKIVLKDPNGNIIHGFSYDDTAPWPTTPDGGGPSLEVIDFDPALYGLGTNWRASYEIGGSPGKQGLAADSDRDGISDGIEMAFGTDPFSASSKPAPVTTLRDAVTGQFTITWSSANGRSYTIEYRDDLATGSWQPLTSVTATGTSSSYTDTTSTTQPQRFYRVTTQIP